jgi:hypothetical protein
MAGIREFGGKMGELRENFVNDADGTAEGMCVEIFCQEATNVAWIDLCLGQ